MSKAKSMAGAKAKEPTNPLVPERTELTEEELRAEQMRRFQERVNRVLMVMKRERVDFQAQAFLMPDGRIGTRVMPVEEGAGQ